MLLIGVTDCNSWNCPLSVIKVATTDKLGQVR